MKDRMNIDINTETMHEFFSEFDTIKHKFLYNTKEKLQEDILWELYQFYYKNNDRSKGDIYQATDVYRTIDKVYNLKTTENEEYCSLLQKITEDILGKYVDIDGIQDLFQASYFNFEWMMHLEYKEREHEYSYYRDHYIHQIRNLYEMFILLDKLDLWHDCMHIYLEKDNIVARQMQRSIEDEKQQRTKAEHKLLKNILAYNHSTDEEFSCHYLIFAVTIVAALVHDIGYPIGYVKRTMGTLQKFLPASYIFMNIENELPRIKSLLNGSLLFEMIPEEEITERLNMGDHGTYSAIILLYQFYDNGQIFKLSPIKKMVIELAAVVIYNHTLKYRFQGKANRVNNVYMENPLSYLFRLCDDLQEWDRVYFEISTTSNFFICGKCEMPMVRNRHGDVEKKGNIPYLCFCGNKGINTNLFDYRRLINVAPFKQLTITGMEKENSLLQMELICSLRALLQMCKYNPRFAVERVRGICEIKEMVKDQKKLPAIYLNTFISANPMAIKTDILRHYMEEQSGINILALIQEINNDAEYIPGLEYLSLKDSELKINNQDDKGIRFIRAKSESMVKIMPDSFHSSKLFMESVNFYLSLLLLGVYLKTKRNEIYSDKIRQWMKEEDKVLPVLMHDYFVYWANRMAAVWKIFDFQTKDLMADCLQQIFCEVTSQEFQSGCYSEMYMNYLCTREDIPDIVEAYTQKDMYETICRQSGRMSSSGEMLFDYYSDYYMYFWMDTLHEENRRL